LLVPGLQGPELRLRPETGSGRQQKLASLRRGLEQQGSRWLRELLLLCLD